jgi:hypothetical protein
VKQAVNVAVAVRLGEQGVAVLWVQDEGGRGVAQCGDFVLLEQGDLLGVKDEGKGKELVRS